MTKPIAHSISGKGLYFIASLEMPNAKPALKAIKSVESNKDGSDKYEIGFGHNSDDFFTVEKDTVVTEKKAKELLKHDVEESEQQFNAFIKKHNLKFIQHEYDALISAMYNGVPVTNEKMGIGKAAINCGHLIDNIKAFAEDFKFSNKIGKGGLNKYAKKTTDQKWKCFEYKRDVRFQRENARTTLVKELKRWVYYTNSNKKLISNGLQNRREAEARLFLNGDYQENPNRGPIFEWVTLSGE